jgi:glutathione synthase/RimK-type ligase-like ATP-grasp enzyme
VPAIWDDAECDWEQFDLVVLRSCWDYFHRIDEFRAWLHRMRTAAVPLLNHADTVEWNLDKRYLLDLERSGVAILETVVAQPGDTIEAIMRERGWSAAVLKPRVSADGHRTHRVDAADAASHQAELDALLAGPGALVQEYAPEIARSGELSFVFIGGEFSHCVRKSPAAGEFRVQATYGGRADPHEATPSDIGYATAVLRAVPYECAYARVDACTSNGALRLMELELIEPSLFLVASAAAPVRLAEALVRAASGAGARARSGTP